VEDDSWHVQIVTLAQALRTAGVSSYDGPSPMGQVRVTLDPQYRPPHQPSQDSQPDNEDNEESMFAAAGVVPVRLALDDE
jgi:hypothetical protein